jgi:hypothetical protein
LSPLNAERATTMKNSSTAIFVMTITVFVRALWRTPETSSAAAAMTRSRDGTFTSPPSPGGSETASLSVIPKSESSSSVK